MGRHTGHINAALFTKDSKQLITVADDKTIRFWDVERGEQDESPVSPHRPRHGRGACSPRHCPPMAKRSRWGATGGLTNAIEDFIILGLFVSAGFVAL